MAVKAKAEITLSRIIDIESVTRYYLLQSSTASAPSKPTANPPGGNWKTTEPSYTSGSTNTLYFVDLTVMTNGTFSYSAVSKSSSYEAAKEAWNKANNAQSTADGANTKADNLSKNITSLAVSNLIANGYGTEKSNYNFDGWTFDGTEVYNGCPSFKLASTVTSIYLGVNLIPIDVSKSYEFSMNLKAVGSEKIYLGWDEWDIDRKYISPTYCYAFGDTTTTLAKELKNGDTVVYLTSTSAWHSTTAAHQLGLIFWNYKDSTGYQYPEGVYSRNAWTNIYTFANVNKTNNTITLNKAWSYGTFPVGTKVSQTNSAGHKYRNYVNTTVPTEWTNTSFALKDIQPDYGCSEGKFSPAAKYVNFMMLHNYGGTSSATTYVNSVRFSDTTMAEAIESTNDDIERVSQELSARLGEAESAIANLGDSISMLVQDSSGASLMEQTENGWIFSMGETLAQIQETVDKLKAIEDDVDAQGGDVEALRTAVTNLENLNSYIRITTSGNAPCIELGNDSSFKVRITNTSIDFMDGTSIPAYISNQSLKIDKAEVENELAFGGFAFKERDNGNMGLIWKG